MWLDDCTWVTAPAAERATEEQKTAFGIALNQHEKPFDAALSVFGEDTNTALWASVNLINDPLVVAAKAGYSAQVAKSDKLLSKDEFAAKLLTIADEKVIHGGKEFYAIEAKDRMVALKLYSEVMGFSGKIAIDASTKSFTHNQYTEIVLVEPDNKPIKKIRQIENDTNVINLDDVELVA